MYEALDLSVSINGRTLISDVAITIPPGRLIAVIGPNGAGKSTLLRALAGEQRPSSGTVKLHGRDVRSLSAAALAGWRAVLAQTVAVTFPFTVDEIVRLGAPPDLAKARAEGVAERALSAVQMLHTRQRPITQLSGGEQQRVHLARVLVQLWAQPEDGPVRYLLLDEPTSHLDPAHQALVAKLARGHAATGGGVLAILHDLNLAAAIADEIVIMRDGRVAARGRPSEIIRESLLADVFGIPFQAITGHGRRIVVPVI